MEEQNLLLEAKIKYHAYIKEEVSTCIIYLNQHISISKTTTMSLE